MIIEANENKYDLSTKLGTTLRIEKEFKKPYLRVLQLIEELTTEQQIAMICCGLTDKDEAKKLKEDIFEEGIEKLTEILEEFIDGLQYPGKTAEEIEEKKLAKIAKQNHMREIGLIK